MSAFAPINVAAGQEQKRQLLAKLMQQYQQNASRAAGMPGASQVGGTAALPHNRFFGGTGRDASQMPNLAKTLIDRLGPGGYGHPIVGHMPGIGANPHLGSPIAPGLLSPGGYANAPTIPVAPTSAPAAPSAPSAPAAPSAPSAPAASVLPPNSPGITGAPVTASIQPGTPYSPYQQFATTPQQQANGAPAMSVDPGFYTAASPTTMIPLSNGVVLHVPSFGGSGSFRAKLA